MDKSTVTQIIRLYRQGYSTRKIEFKINKRYRREAIRENLKKTGLILRGRGMKYKNPKLFSSEESDLFAEFLGYFYGDGSLHKFKTASWGLYDCHLAFSLNEKDLVNRVTYISKMLFEFKPKIIKTNSFYSLKFRRSFAKYLNEMDYPAGKKSEINPNLPLHMLKNDSMKKHFICGFLNAEATVNKTIAVQQSVRFNLSKEMIDSLKQQNNAYKLGKINCYFIKFSKIKSFMISNIRESNILLDLKRLLNHFEIKSTIYPIRLYIGKEDKTSIHFELQISPRFIKDIKELKMLSCKKKSDKLNELLQG